MTIDARIAALACRQDGLFTTSQALAVDAYYEFLRRRVLQGVYIRVYRSVYRVAAVPASWRQRVRAVALAIPAGAIAGRAAAVLWGLDPFRPGPIEVAVPNGRRTTLIGARTTDLRPEQVSVIEGIRVTSPERTLVDLARDVDARTLELAVDSALRLRLVTLDSLIEAVDELCGHGRRGSARIRAVVEELDGRAFGSRLERQFLELLRRAGLPFPVKQREIHDDAGRLRYLDFMYADIPLGVEIDGYSTHMGPEALDDDNERHNDLGPHIRWLRFTSRHIRRRPEWVVERVAWWREQVGGELHPPA